jgi:O-antigen/teichoic acid export membrane protein
VLVLTRPISANTSSIYQAVGKPEYNTYAGLVLIVVMVPFAFLLLPYGFNGVAVAVLLADIAGLLFNIVLTNHLLPGSAGRTVRASLPALVAALIMFGIVVVSQSYLLSMIGENIWSLAIVVATGVVVYVPLIYLFQREFTKEVGQTMIKALDRKGRIKRFIAKRKPA